MQQQSYIGEIRKWKTAEDEGNAQPSIYPWMERDPPYEERSKTKIRIERLP